MSESVDQQGEISVGLRLQKARMEKKLSQVQVAEKLFLTTQIIECLDDGAFERIPKKAFIRGYIRAYARVVGLEGSELVAAYDAEVGRDEGQGDEATILMNAEDPSLAKNPIFRAGAMGIAVLVIVVLFVWMVMSGGQGDRSGPPPSSVKATSPSAGQARVETSSTTTPGSSVGNENSPSTNDWDVVPDPEDGRAQDSAEIAEEAYDEARLDEEPALSPVDQDRDLAAEDLSEQEPSQASQSSEVERETGDVALAGEVEAPPVRSALGASVGEATPNVFRSVTDTGRFIQVIVDGEDTVVIQTTESCWVEVADATGYLLYGDLNQSGDELEVIGAAPFQILLGKASAAQVRFNGQVVDLEPHTTREFTARLTVGESADES
ncbi:MAG: RodZ domain-containing protein [Gammaproteobacteria bacterium]